MIVPNSRYVLGTVVQHTDPLTDNPDQPPFIDLRSRVTGEENDDSLITIDASMTWANLGFNRLGDARFWWAIADLSGVIDPFTELTPGSQLRAPSIPRLLFDVLAPENTSNSPTPL